MISIVVPVHNEEKRIVKILEKYSVFFEEKKKKKEIDDFELLFVINNTTDRTEEIIQAYSKKYKEIRHIRFKEGGKGFAIICGFKDALKRKNNLIGFVDGDMSTPPEAFYDLIKGIDGYDGIIADRWNKRSIITPKQSTFRRFVSRGYNWIVRTLFLFNHRDTQCGAKLFKREIIEKNINKLVTSNWGFDIALLYCLKKESKAKIKAIPTIWHDEVGSKVNIKKTPIRMLLSGIRLRLIHSPFKFIVRFYRKLPQRMKMRL
ncbi:Glycosyltransferase AglD [uncultured archaeon]|nr:Glycosyltransferase AglD [uncultured archaeon]